MGLQHLPTPIMPPGPDTTYIISPQTTMTLESYMMPTQCLSRFMAAKSSPSWSYGKDYPISFSQRRQPDEAGAWEVGRHFQSAFERYHLRDLPSPSRLRAHREMMAHGSQSKTTGVLQFHHRASRNISGRNDRTAIKVSRGTYNCDYPNCSKAYSRLEHLKRHKTR